MSRNSGGARRQALFACARSLMTAGALIAGYYLLPLGSVLSAGTALALVGGLAVVALLLAWQTRRITLSPWPGLRAMETLAAIVPLFVLLFATAYWLMEHSASESFSESLSRTDALYLAMTVFSTVGFGDITPRSEPARLLITGQMTVDLLLIGVAARLLVNAVQEGRRQRDRSATGGENGTTSTAR